MHTGARIASQAQPAEVLVSSTVKDLVAGSGITSTIAAASSSRAFPGTGSCSQSTRLLAGAQGSRRPATRIARQWLGSRRRCSWSCCSTATTAAFALTEGLKLQKSPSSGTKVDEIFSPVCDCEKDAALIRFSLRERDRLDVSIVDGDEHVVRTIVRNEDEAAGRSSSAGRQGRRRQGAPRGRVPAAIHLRRERRTILMPNPIRIDVTPPVVEAARARPRVSRRMATGEARSGCRLVPVRASLRRRLLYVNGTKRVETLFARERDKLSVVRPRRRERGATRPYVLNVRARDPAGNLGPARAPRHRHRCATSRSAGRGWSCSRGARFPIRVSSDARRVRWTLGGRSGLARPGTLRLRAPLQPGRFTPDSVGQRSHGACCGVRARACPVSVTATELAQVAGPVGCLGLALLARRDAIGGCASPAWRRGERAAGLALSLAPDGHTALLAAAAAAGARPRCRGRVAPAPLALAASVRDACLHSGPHPRGRRRRGGEPAPAALPRRRRVRARARLASSAAATTAPASSARLALPLAAFVAWTGLTLAWSEDVREGAIFVCSRSCLPFGLLAIGFARLPWSRRALLGSTRALVGTALAYASIGLYQWATRDVFWNPKVIVGNAYAPFFRVNSIFWDPSIYGRYLVVGILATLAAILLGGAGAGPRAVARSSAIWAGLLFLLLPVELRRRSPSG